MRSLARTAWWCLAVMGGARVWRHWREQCTRGHVASLERHLRYDEDLRYAADRGYPIILVDPKNDRSLFFLGGFRIRTNPGQYREWFEELHCRHGVNVIAPVLGLQSMPFELRATSWRTEREMRMALQLFDAYTAALPSGHRVVCASASFGAVANLTIAANRGVRDVILIAPIGLVDAEAEGALPLAGRLRGRLFRPFARIVSRALFRGNGRMADLALWAVAQVMPYYTRPRLEGGWDIDDEACRAHANQHYALPPETRVADFREVLRALRMTREHLVPRVRGKRILVAWGARDSVVPPRANRDLVDLLRGQGNDVEPLVCESSAHAILLDREAQLVHDAVLRFVQAAGG